MMSGRTIRLLRIGLVVVLLSGIAATYLIVSRPTADLPGGAATAGGQHMYLLDVAGWYQLTPDESAVGSPFVFQLGQTTELPKSVGAWTGNTLDFGDYANEIDKWFDNPDLALSSSYVDAAQHSLWFSVFGSAGKKSYSLFEHTPVTSYPANGWTLLDSRIIRVQTGAGTFSVNRAYLQLPDSSEKRVVYYWYLWSDTQRDPEKGIMTMRLHVPVPAQADPAVADQSAQDFIRSLFPQVLPWHRF